MTNDVRYFVSYAGRLNGELRFGHVEILHHDYITDDSSIRAIMPKVRNVARQDVDPDLDIEAILYWRPFEGQEGK